MLDNIRGVIMSRFSTILIGLIFMTTITFLFSRYNLSPLINLKLFE